MTRLIALWRKEWLALRRDPHALAALFVMPAVFILIMSFALRDAIDPPSGRLRIALIDLDHSALSQRFAATLAKDGQAVADRAQAMRLIAQGKADFAVAIGAGFAATVNGADADAPLPVQILADPTVAVAAQQAFRQSVAARMGQLRAAELSRRIQGLLGVPLPVVSTSLALPPLELVGAAGIKPSAVQQSVPAWLIFGLFFVVIPLAPVFIAERQNGTLIRLRALGVTPLQMLLGKLPPFVGVNLLQAALMFAVGVLVVPALGGEALRLPASAWALLPLCVATSLAAVAWAFVVAALARSAEQATVVGGVGNILMGAIGGVMVPRFVMPPAMQSLTSLSPMAWALEGFHKVLLRGEGLAALAGTLLALSAFAFICVLLASLILRARRDL
ncbi:ABC transporter permease [Niveibacterium terrae]|uniref:ABC transporter permease n=1 Tax=Niveibacterium terrae TaxID=3373598 RepID=UPI003A8F9C7F